MSSNENVVEKLVEIQKQNQELLKIIAESQTLMLGLEREKKALEKRKIWFGAVKYIFWVIAIWASFIFTQKLTESFLGNGMGNGMRTVGNSASSITETVENLLNGGGDSGVQSELDRYFGN